MTANSVAQNWDDRGIETREFERMKQRVAQHRHCWRAELNELRPGDEGMSAPDDTGILCL